MSICYKARRVALGIVMEDQKVQFAKLWDYEAELRRSNPNTTTKIRTVTGHGNKQMFDRFYVCFEALRETWKQYCRPVIGIDECFLKWTLKGELLAAVGRDGNNQMYPIAWAVVRVENNDTWAWFVNKLKEDLSLGDGCNVTIISDKQKGLVNAVANILPRCEHRMCARHIYANWKKTYKDIDLKNLFWSIANSCYKGEFDRHMEALEQYNPAAYDALLATEPRQWAKTFFRTDPHCEDILNNISESFNMSIRAARQRPLIDMLEAIRRQTMQRIAKRAMVVSRCKTDLTTFAMKELIKNQNKTQFCISIPSGYGKYEVVDSGVSYALDLSTRRCVCRKWEQTYERNINPLNGEPLWVKTHKEPIAVPGKRKMPGRPKKFNRTKEAHEKDGHLSRHGRRMTCSQCKQVGHNIKTCKNEPIQHFGPFRGRGRPRKFKERGESSSSAPRRQRNSSGEGLSFPTQSSQTVQSALPHLVPRKRPRTLGITSSDNILPWRTFNLPHTGRDFRAPRQQGPSQHHDK